jgi:hypothetical protein
MLHGPVPSLQFLALQEANYREQKNQEWKEYALPPLCGRDESRAVDA